MNSAYTTHFRRKAQESCASVIVHKLVKMGKGKNPSTFLARSCLAQQQCEVRSSLREKIPTPCKQATDTFCIGRNCVASHRTIPFFNPPAKCSFTRIGGSIYSFAFRSFPTAIARQTKPEIPAISREQSQAIGHAHRLTRTQWHCLTVAMIHDF